MNIEYLDLVLSTTMTLRKVKSILLKEKKGEYNLRPQMHILIVSPFGTFKSSITKKMEKLFPKDVYPIDNFTRPSIEGSIGRDGEYIPSLIVRLGGKLMIIDEWNSVDYSAQIALLGILENQRINRTLGFKVRRPFKFKNKYGYFKISENLITGGMFFSCLAYAMHYPLYSNSQESKALLSRYCPLFMQPTMQFMEANTSGSFEMNVNDCSQKVDNVIISKECYEKFHDLYYDFVKTNKLIPFDTDDYGFISRILSDIVRFGVYNYLSKNETDDKNILIEKHTYFTEMFIYIRTLMQQYMNPNTKSKFAQYQKLLRDNPGKKKDFYYNTLGISRQTLWEYDQKIGKRVN